MIKKINKFTEEEKELGYKAFQFYQTYKGRTATKEVFNAFRYRKCFYELGKKYPEFNTEISINDYMKYIIDNNVPFKHWIDTNTFRNFLLIFTKQEEKEPAIIRSKEFLNKKGYDINTISENRLILYLECGNVSPWLVLTEYPDFFEEINKQKNNVFCRNILNYYFWKLKLSEINKS